METIIEFTALIVGPVLMLLCLVARVCVEPRKPTRRRPF